MKKKLYISGPISFYPNENREMFLYVADTLQVKGYEAINPHNIAACHDGSCSGSINDKDGNWIHTHGCYLKYDLQVMLTCDGVAMLDGWEFSKGARLEMETALAVGMRVDHYRHWSNTS